jgi:hypothetical protein
LRHKALLQKLHEKIQTLNLKRMTVKMRIGYIKIYTAIQFSEIFSTCVLCSYIVDRSMDITLTAQMCIFARVITSHVKALEEL